MLLLYEKYWGPKEATFFATDLLNAVKYKNVGQGWPGNTFFLERLKAVNLYYNDQKKVTDHKGHLQTVEN